MSNTALPPALFLDLGNGQYRPTDLSYGPWVPDTQHGSAMMALAAHAAEQHPCRWPHQVVRLTVDMMKAAPMADIDVEVVDRTVGGNLNVIDIYLRHAGKVYVQASAVRMRVNPLPVPDEVQHRHNPPLPDPFAMSYFERHLGTKGFHNAVDLRFDDSIEPGVLWMRITAPVVDSKPLSGFERAAMCADWTYSTFNIRNRVRALRKGEDHTPTFISINVDTTLNLSRMPQGEWIGIQTRPHYEPVGSGIAAAWVLDEQGVCGASMQSLLVRPAEKAPMHVQAKIAEEAERRDA